MMKMEFFAVIFPLAASCSPSCGDGLLIGSYVEHQTQQDQFYNKTRQLLQGNKNTVFLLAGDTGVNFLPPMISQYYLRDGFQTTAVITALSLSNTYKVNKQFHECKYERECSILSTYLHLHGKGGSCNQNFLLFILPS